MGRNRREPKNDKDAKELDRLRRNQAACRQRKLDLIEKYRKGQEDTEKQLNESLKTLGVYLDKINGLYTEMMHVEQMTERPFNFQKMQKINQEINDIQQFYNQMNSVFNSYKYQQLTSSSSRVYHACLSTSQ